MEGRGIEGEVRFSASLNYPQLEFTNHRKILLSDMLRRSIPPGTVNGQKFSAAEKLPFPVGLRGHADVEGLSPEVLC